MGLVSHINYNLQIFNIFLSNIISSKSLLNHVIKEVLPRNVVILHGKKYDMKSLKKKLVTELYDGKAMKTKIIKKGQEIDLKPERKYTSQYINIISQFGKTS